MFWCNLSELADSKPPNSCCRHLGPVCYYSHGRSFSSPCNVTTSHISFPFLRSAMTFLHSRKIPNVENNNCLRYDGLFITASSSLVLRMTQSHHVMGSESWIQGPLKQVWPWKRTKLANQLWGIRTRKCLVPSDASTFAINHASPPVRTIPHLLPDGGRSMEVKWKLCTEEEKDCSPGCTKATSRLWSPQHPHSATQLPL